MTKDTLGTVFYSNGFIRIPRYIVAKANLFNTPDCYPEHTIVSRI